MKRFRGAVYAWGSGDCHKLGYGEYTFRKNPVKLEIFNDCQVVKLACGASHSVCLLKGSPNQIFTWYYFTDKRGSNFYGQAAYMENRSNLGNFFQVEDQIEDEIDTVTLPTHLKRLSNTQITDISVGNFGNFAISDQNLYSWGGGILGHKKEYYDSNPTLISFFNEIGRKPTKVSSLTDLVVAIANEVYIWGYLQNSQLTKAVEPVLVANLLDKPVKSIKAGPNSFSCLLSDNSLEIYGKPSVSSEIPGFPLMTDCKIIAKVADFKPSATLKLPNLIDYVLGHSKVLVRLESQLLLFNNFHLISSLDIKNCVKIAVSKCGNVFYAITSDALLYKFDSKWSFEQLQVDGSVYEFDVGWDHFLVATDSSR